MSTASKPLPQPTPQSQPFWDACAKRELQLQRCDDCRAWRFPPADRCPECLSARSQWTRTSGRGRVYSFVVFHRAYHPAFADELPYAVALVELEEGPRLLANIVDCPIDCVRCEMPVEVVFDDVAPATTLYRFKRSSL